MMTASEITIMDEIAEELDREVEVRKRVFPRWVKDGKLEQETADRRIRLMEMAAAYLRMQRYET